MKFKNQKSIYRQIADFILDSILEGHISAGERIQSVREMASEVQVNPNTVMRTYNYLSEKDIIFNKRGVGYFTTQDALEKTKALKKEYFLSEQLPMLFESMKLLQIDIGELSQLLNQYQIEHHEVK
ncbi:MAG: GntR family transcriptional regulator [Bacteroidota bacterium]